MKCARYAQILLLNRRICNYVLVFAVQIRGGRSYACARTWRCCVYHSQGRRTAGTKGTVVGGPMTKKKNIYIYFLLHNTASTQQRLHTAIKIYTFLFQMRSWLLKGMGDGTLIDLLDLLLCPNKPTGIATNPF